MRIASGTLKRKPTNLSLDPSLVKEAKGYELNISNVVEKALREAVAEERRRRWLEENAEAIAAYNRHVEKHGVGRGRAPVVSRYPVFRNPRNAKR